MLQPEDQGARSLREVSLVVKKWDSNVFIHEACGDSHEPFVLGRPIEWAFWIVGSVPVDKLSVIVGLIVKMAARLVIIMLFVSSMLGGVSRGVGSWNASVLGLLCLL
jgi:hypothetical protein